MLCALSNKSWKQHPTKQQLYGHRPPISKTIQIRRKRYVRHCWRSTGELISDVLLWTPSYGQTGVGRLTPARTYLQQLCTVTGCSLEDLTNGMDDRDEWSGRVQEIRAHSTTSCWWWLQSNTNNLCIDWRFQVFLTNTNNSIVSSNHSNLMIIICLHTVICFQETNNNILSLGVTASSNNS